MLILAATPIGNLGDASPRLREALANADVIAAAACRAALESGATLIACFSRSGTTARLLSHFRPSMPVVAFSPDQATRRLRDALAAEPATLPPTVAVANETGLPVSLAETPLTCVAIGTGRAMEDPVYRGVLITA